MSSYYMGYEYDMPKRGEGYRLETERILISRITKKSAQQVRSQMISEGVAKETITIEAN